LILITNERVGNHEDHIYEYRPAERPQIKIDCHEIIEAGFVDPDELAGADHVIQNYFRAVAKQKNVEIVDLALSRSYSGKKRS
jgi:hypothetical protein